MAEPDKAAEPEIRTARPLAAKGRVARRLGPSIVLVNYSIPFRTDGVYAASFSGVGVVVDKDEGLVLVDRDTVTAGLGDASVVFAGSVEVPASVLAIHPTTNLALIQYDPSTIGDTEVVELVFDEDGFLKFGPDGKPIKPHEATRILCNELFDLMKEKLEGFDGIDADCVDRDVHTWRVRITDINEASPLHGDLAALGRRLGGGAAAIELELRFTPDMHPFFPTWVKILYPRFEGQARAAREVIRA